MGKILECVGINVWFNVLWMLFLENNWKWFNEKYFVIIFFVIGIFNKKMLNVMF